MELVSENITCWQTNKHIIKGYKNFKKIGNSYLLLCLSEIFGWSTLFLITRKRTSRSRAVLLAASSLKHSQTRFIYDLICGNRFDASSHSRLWLLQQYLWSSSGAHMYWTSAARSSTMSHPAPLIIYSIYAEFSEHYSLAILQKAFHHHQQDSLKAFLYQWVTFFCLSSICTVGSWKQNLSDCFLTIYSHTGGHRGWKFHSSNFLISLLFFFFCGEKYLVYYINVSCNWVSSS